MGLFDGKVAIVTGAAMGIGQAYAQAFAAEGASVVIADIADLGETTRLIEDAGSRILALDVDVTDLESTERLAAAVGSEYGRIDVLVNNAAVYRTLKLLPFDQLPVAEWDKVFAVNTRGPWLCARAVFPHMKEQRSGKVINISSMTAFKKYTLPDDQGFLHYVASKAAVTGLTRGLSIEMGPYNICVNTVVPEYIPTGIWGDEVDGFVMDEKILKRTQTPQDMVGVVLFLAGKGSDMITGQTIMVNGGSIFQ
jgi:NAD(P)-dependent dehydrogenase (short-subunit alcohol dehydrogenase family)